MLTATYSPEDNKLRLYASARLEPETFQRVRAAGFIWAPKQDLFVAPAWTPEREDLLLGLAGEIDDEDTSLVDRAEQRADRFEDYSQARAEDAAVARDAVSAIADGIPLGQPILVGHHSERHARRDAEKIQNGMRRAVRMWEQSQYWRDRAKGAIRAAKYKERPDVRARRIKGLEAEQRKHERTVATSERFLKLWSLPALTQEQAERIANHPDAGPWGVWSDLHEGRITAAQAAEQGTAVHIRRIEHGRRWLAHVANRLEYERAMLAESGGTAADRTKPEKGGACRCWASPGYGAGWAYIVKVNKVSVTIGDPAEYGGRVYGRIMPFDKLKALMSAAEVSGAREDGRLVETPDRTGFYLTDAPASAPPGRREAAPSEFEGMKESLRAGVQIVSAPDLFPTPPELARRMVEAAGIKPEYRVLEPSAGTGNILRAIGDAPDKVAVEINPRLVEMLACGVVSGLRVHQADFLTCNGDLGLFDRIIMNPPFSGGQDIEHVRHAYGFLNPGGRLVAIMSEGPFFRQDRKAAEFRAWLEEVGGESEQLPPGTFQSSGTGVSTRLVVIRRQAGG